MRLGGGNQWTPMNNLDAGYAERAAGDHPHAYPGGLVHRLDITDLAASASCASGSILLSWSAPGGTGTCWHQPPAT